MLRNIMLTIAYDGTAYRGWQIQPNGLTVQECIETATEKLFGTRHKLMSSSRTDSGVHALGQVASFKTNSRIPNKQIRRGLQRFLHDDIAIVNVQDVADDFHATYSAIRKRYRYLIYDGPVLPPFLRNYVMKSRPTLNVAAMQQSLQGLMGTHDFRCFETSFPNKSTSVRTVMEASIQRVPHWSIWNPPHHWQPLDKVTHDNAKPHEDPGSPLICFEIMADGFLYNMVRAIVGTIVRVGTERWPVEYVGEVVSSMDRNQAGSTAPAEGLCLVKVDYPEEQLIAPTENA